MCCYFCVGFLFFFFVGVSLNDAIKRISYFITKQLFGFATNNRPVDFIFNIDIIKVKTTFVRGTSHYAND